MAEHILPLRQRVDIVYPGVGTPACGEIVARTFEASPRYDVRVSSIAGEGPGEMVLTNVPHSCVRPL